MDIFKIFGKAIVNMRQTHSKMLVIMDHIRRNCPVNIKVRGVAGGDDLYQGLSEEKKRIVDAELKKLSQKNNEDEEVSEEAMDILKAAGIASAGIGGASLLPLLAKSGLFSTSNVEWAGNKLYGATLKLICGGGTEEEKKQNKAHLREQMHLAEMKNELATKRESRDEEKIKELEDKILVYTKKGIVGESKENKISFDDLLKKSEEKTRKLMEEKFTAIIKSNESKPVNVTANNNEIINTLLQYQGLGLLGSGKNPELTQAFNHPAVFFANLASIVKLAMDYVGKEKDKSITTISELNSVLITSDDSESRVARFSSSGDLHVMKEGQRLVDFNKQIFAPLENDNTRIDMDVSSL